MNEWLMKDAIYDGGKRYCSLLEIEDATGNRNNEILILVDGGEKLFLKLAHYPNEIVRQTFLFSQTMTAGTGGN